MEHDLRNRTLALAAVFQYVCAVNQLAQSGQVEANLLQQAIHSISKLSAANLEEVYEGINNLKPGLDCLEQQLGGDADTRNREIMRYAVSILHLERKLDTYEVIRGQLAQGLQATQRQYEYFASPHENIISALAGLYTETISQLGPRIIVRGDPRQLSNTAVASRVRVLLLAAIRAAVLWRQAGGNRWRLLIGRSAILQEARRLLMEVH